MMQVIVTKALQVAIQVRKDGGTVQQAKNEASNLMWREYTPEAQAAAERAITGYFGVNVTPVAMPVGPTLVDSVVERVKSRLLGAVNPDGFTKAELIGFGSVLGVKLPKSANKDRLLSILQSSMLPDSLAA
jgi:hypothetical protein